MRLPPLGLVIAAFTATQAAADSLITYRSCTLSECNSSRSVWFNDIGQAYNFNANDKCREPGVPNIVEVCMDWARGGASFKTVFGATRCLRKGAETRKSFIFSSLRFLCTGILLE